MDERSHLDSCLIDVATYQRRQFSSWQCLWSARVTYYAFLDEREADPSPRSITQNSIWKATRGRVEKANTTEGTL